MFGCRSKRAAARLRGATSLAAALLLAGCAGLPLQAPVPSSNYVLEAMPAGAPALAAAGPTLLVELPTADAGYAGPEMVYMQAPHQLEQFAHHRWVDTPARMLQPLLVAAAENSGLFRAVISGGSRSTADLRLETTLVRLRQDFLQTPSRVQLVARVHLLDARTGNLLASRLFEVKQPASEDTPYGGVLAANRAASQLLLELQVFLRTTLGESG